MKTPTQQALDLQRPLDAKPAPGAQSSQPGLVCTAYNEIHKGTLVAQVQICFTKIRVTLTCYLNEKNDSRWVQPPAKEWTGKDGQRKFESVIDFGGKDRQRIWSDEAVRAVDRYLQANPR